MAVRPKFAFVVLVLAVLLPSLRALAQEPVSSGPAVLSKPWTGDLDGMIKRRLIRVLTVYNKANFFIDKGNPHGSTYDGLKAFETELNKTRQTKGLAVHCVFIPVGRDELIPALLEGRGDIAAGNIYITAERRKQVDFSEPVLSGISQIAVTGPGAPPLSGLDSLSGKTVFVRKGSSMHLNLERLNATFKKAGKASVRFSFAPEHLEDEDLLEMTNAGPGRISQLRREAAQRGLNPNVWFNNVEVVALEKTGRETVQYISNIAKYYLAYKLVTEEQEARQKAKEGLKKS